MKSKILETIKNIRSDISQKPGFSFPDIENAICIELKSDEKKISIEKSTIINRSKKSNYIVFLEQQNNLEKTKIEFDEETDGNIVIFGSNSKLEGKILFKGCNNTFIFSGSNKKKVYLNIGFQKHTNSSLFFWGKGSTSNSIRNRVVIQGNQVNCLVGDDCMFSSGVALRTSDMHTIFDIASESQINRPGNIVIEPHVWLGQDVLILKKSFVGFGSIIGAKSLVSNNIPHCCIAAGVPAKVIRENCSWDRSHHVTRKNLNYVLNNRPSTVTY